MDDRSGLLTRSSSSSLQVCKQVVAPQPLEANRFILHVMRFEDASDGVAAAEDAVGWFGAGCFAKLMVVKTAEEALEAEVNVRHVLSRFFGTRQIKMLEAPDVMKLWNGKRVRNGKRWQRERRLDELGVNNFLGDCVRRLRIAIKISVLSLQMQPQQQRLRNRMSFYLKI
jgi:hypothetical protein